MKKDSKYIWLALSVILIISFSVISFSETEPINIENIFENIGSVMLIIDPINGDIINANRAAAQFYGYSVDELTQMKIQQINNLTPGEIQIEMTRAITQERTYFNFEHKLKDGSIRYVEVYSYPFENEKSENLLLSTVYDITPRLLAEKKSLQNRVVIYILAALLIISLSIAFVFVKKAHDKTIAYS
ncbi:MAG TPA: hypothetical protein DCS67_06270 [Clostridiales bacterium UBA8960]|jgi:PAS domain S-box-containing protein|nr:hypothetical protein [Clostridiales bacterium UBA8960]